MDFQLLSKELDQFLSSNWKEFKKLVLTDLLDKNGTTKEMKVKDSKKKEKPHKRTDLKTYLNYSFTFYSNLYNDSYPRR